MSSILPSALIGLLGFFSTSTWAAGCAFEPPASVIAEAGETHEPGARLFQVWDLPDSPVLWTSETPDSPGYAAFRRDLAASGFETDPIALLRVEQKSGELAADLFNRSVVLERAEIWIGPANCVEKVLVGIQNERIAILSTSTEFAAVILRSADGRRVRIYHYAKNDAGFGGVGELLAPVVKDRRDGWTVQAMLHNHNFSRDDNLSSGVLAPSAADGQLQLALSNDLQLQETWITNGVHTVRIPSTEFTRFQLP